MTKLEKSKILDDLGMEWKITETGEMICLVKMSTFAGDDCSEWLNAEETIKEMKEQKYIS